MNPSKNHVQIPLSKLIPTRRNVRRVKPERDAHRRLVASIRAHGLLFPLVVRPAEDDDSQFRIVAGNRRLAALREVHKGAKTDPKIPCQVRAVDDATAEALGLTENFTREPMHPLEEAEAFARLAGEDGKNALAIAADFGVGAPYVRQRMKLATLAEVVKAAYREGTIDTGTAEAFAAVPPERQSEIWTEVGGQPHHAEHVRRVIAHGWIEAGHALFDLAKLPDSVVSRDLFSERVLVERKAFLDAQAEALVAERETLIEDGWAEVVLARQQDVQDRLWSMDSPPVEYDAATQAALAKLDRRRRKWEEKLEAVDEGDEAKLEAIGAKIEALDVEERTLAEGATIRHSEATKAVATAFLMLDPDGRVRREYRVPRVRHTPSVNGNLSNGLQPVSSPPPPPLTSDDLREGQLGATFTHEALAVRQALLGNTLARKQVLALALHDKVRKEAIALRSEANATTLHADHSEGFASPARDELARRRKEVDPFAADHSVTDDDAYERLESLTEKQLDELIALLTVDCISAHPMRRTELVQRLAVELGVNVRDQWRPDAAWLAGYQKVQLAHLIGELRGLPHAAAAEHKKKSELVEILAALFTDAADGKLADPALADRVNQWLPSNLRPKRIDEAGPQDDDDRQEAA